MIALSSAISPKLVVYGILILAVVGFGVHYNNLRTDLDSVKHDLAVEQTQRSNLQSLYDQVIVDYQADIIKFKDLAALQNDRIKKYEQSAAAVEAATKVAMDEYQNRVKTLQGNVSNYKKMLAERKPLENTCPSGFQFVFSEIKENSSW